MCYTSGTTGNPKGVVYSHRSTLLHTMGVMMRRRPRRPGDATSSCRSCPCSTPTPGAWPTPRVAAGADLVMPGPDLSPEGARRPDRGASGSPSPPACRPSGWACCPSSKGRDTSSPAGHPVRRLRGAQGAVRGVPRADRPADHAGVGHDRDQPGRLGRPASSRPRPPASDEELADLRTIDRPAARSASSSASSTRSDRSSRAVGRRDAAASCRSPGPWIARTYYNDDRSPESFTDDGWLRTGDVATVDAEGYIRLVDRTKDVVKSGGEWISSVELENEIMAHPEGGRGRRHRRHPPEVAASARWPASW